MTELKRIEGEFRQTAYFQTNYLRLLLICDEHGTMIHEDRLLEKDADIAPYRFFRRGTREYVFPKQQVTKRLDASRIIDPNENYKLWTETSTYAFDSAQAQAHIRIEYEDSNNRPILVIHDQLVKHASVLPAEVAKTIDDICRAPVAQK